MVLGKLDQQKFPFFRGASAAATSDIYNNSAYGVLTLEVSGASSISLKVQGCVNVENADKTLIPDNNLVWSDLAVIDTKDYSVGSSITANGIYAIGISGLAKIRVVIESISGTANVIGVMEA